MANTIITIGRQFGSNGRLIGEKLAELMGVKCYDKQLIKEAAKQSGLWEDFLDNMDEKPTSSFLYSVVMDPYSYMSFDSNTNYGMNLNQKAFMATYETIKSIADRESCVIIGRCSNYVLREYEIEKCFYGHVHGGNAAKKAFIGEKDGISFRLIACDYVNFTPLSIK